MRYRGICFCGIEKTGIRGLVSLGASPHNCQQVLQRVERSSAGAKCVLLVVQAHSTSDAFREELGKQLVDNPKERKGSVVRAVPRVAPFRQVDNHSLTPRGGYASGGNDSVKQVCEHLNPCATRIFEDLRRDAIVARCFVIFKAAQAVTHFVEREFNPQPEGIVTRVCLLSFQRCMRAPLLRAPPVPPALAPVRLLQGTPPEQPPWQRPSCTFPRTLGDVARDALAAGCSRTADDSPSKNSTTRAQNCTFMCQEG